MRKLFYTLPVYLFIVLTLTGCGWLYSIGGAPENGQDMSELDIFLPEFSYVDQDNETFTNEEFEGQHTLVSMIFTRCPTVCNLMTPNMSSLQADVEKEGLDVNFVSFTVDPEFDSPEQLKDYGENYNADFSTWSFLTGYEQEEITQLAEQAFQSPVQNDPENNDIIHATSFFLVDETGQVIRRYDGLENDTSLIVDDLNRL